MTKTIAEFGTRPRAFAVVHDPRHRKPFLVGRVNSRGEVVEWYSYRATEAAATSRARQLAAEQG